MTVADILGWIGAFLLLLAYFLLVHKNLTSRSKRYQGLNVLGALLLAVSTYEKEAFPSFWTNVAWFFIGLYGVFHIVKHRRSMKKR